MPEVIITDNGPPYFSNEMKQYAKKMGFKHHLATPLHPESNGLAENFVKQICKLVHTSIVEGKDPKNELNTFLLHYRAAPHSTTGQPPAELLFGRKIQTKLPQLHNKCNKKMNADIRTAHDNKKKQQKLYFDKSKKSSKKVISEGDHILIKQKKQQLSHHSILNLIKL